MDTERMSATVTWGLFSLTVPEGWCYEEEDGVVSVYDGSGGVGALQISVARIVGGPEDPRLLAQRLSRDYAEQRGWEVTQRRTTMLRGSAIAEFSCEIAPPEATFWQIWHIVGPTHVAFITYNCASNDEERELAAIVAIVDTFRWREQVREANGVKPRPS